MESGEFLGQLAQFGTVQGLAGLQTSFDSLASSLVSNQALQASSARGPFRAGGDLDASASPRASPSRAPSICPRRRAPSALRFATRRARRSARCSSARSRQGSRRSRGTGSPTTASAAPAGRYTFSADVFVGHRVGRRRHAVRAPIDSVLLGADGFSVELRGIGEVPFTAVREIRNEVVTGAGRCRRRHQLTHQEDNQPCHLQ